MPFEWASALTGTFSGLLGGIVPAFVAYRMGQKNINASLDINKAKIDADRAALEIKYEQEMKKLRYEQRKKLCTDFLSTINPHIVGIGEFDTTKSVFYYTLICLECPAIYANYAKKLQELLFTDETILGSFGKKFEPGTDDYHNLINRLTLFLPFYNIFIIITQEMLKENELPSPRKWNLDDYEGSIPLEYRQLFA